MHKDEALSKTAQYLIDSCRPGAHVCLICIASIKHVDAVSKSHLTEDEYLRQQSRLTCLFPYLSGLELWTVFLNVPHQLYSKMGQRWSNTNIKFVTRKLPCCWTKLVLVCRWHVLLLNWVACGGQRYRSPKPHWKYHNPQQQSDINQ